MPVTINDRIREQINRAGSRIVRVVAVAKDGELKRFVFNASPEAQKNKLAPIVSIQHAQGADTRKRNNPDLVNIWDMSAKRWRCFDLNRVISVKCGAETPYRFLRG